MTTHYSHPDGSTTGAGTVANPVDLQTALQSSAIASGDELILLPGLYKPKVATKMQSTLINVIISSQSTTLANRAEIDFWNSAGNLHSNLTVLGSKQIWKNIEFFCSVPKPRITTATGSWAAETDRLEVKNSGSENEFHSCIFHDFNNGLTSQHLAQGGLIDSCYMYNNGWIGGDRPHGHGCYIQNDGTKRKTFRNNLVWNNYDDGIDVYGSSAPILGISLLENTGIGNGKRNLVYVGETVIKDGIVEDNWCFQPPNSGVNGEDTLALSSPPQWTPINESITLRRNMILGAIRASQGFKTFTLEENFVLLGRDSRFADIAYPSGATVSIANNDYYSPSSSGSARFMVNSATKSLAEWQALGYDTDTEITTAQYTTHRHLVAAKSDRMHLTVWNPSKLSTVSATLPASLKYKLYSMYDLDSPVLTGEGNSLQIPMGSKLPQIPLGTQNRVATNDPRFESFILEFSTSTQPPVEPPSVITPPTGTTYKPLFADQDGKFYTLEQDGKFKRI